MKLRILATLIGLCTLALTTSVMAKPHIEIGAMGSTNTVLDDSFEFFAMDYMVHDTWGVDVRVEVLEIKKVLHLLPFISYRYGDSSGEPFMVDTMAYTTLQTHDLDVGARFRGWLLPWLGAYAQLYTGFTHIQMELDTSLYAGENTQSQYRDDKNKWNLGATAGVEFRISPRILKRHNITRFNVGAELGVGFIKRMTTKFDPSLEGGDELSLENTDTVNFGNIDLSGIVFQLGLTVSFL